MKKSNLETTKIHKPLESNKSTLGSNLSKYFLDYSRNTTIHGIKYIGEKNRSIPEKLCWLIVLSISFSICVYLINKMYQKWQNSPVVVTFANNPLAVWEVPFPAITICPSSNTRKTFYDYTEAYINFRKNPENMTERELKQYEQISVLCGDYWNQEGSKILENDTIDFLYKISHNSSEWWCRWDHLKGKGGGCDNLLTPVLTDAGICYTFNILDREEFFTETVHHQGNLFYHGVKSTNWTVEKGYPKNSGSDVYPRRTTAGTTLSFSILLLSYEPDLDCTCGGFKRGFQLYLHNPNEMPRMTQQFFMVSYNKIAMISIEPDMMTTSGELKNYDSQKRQCYFSHERKLKYFQMYTQRNCELECFTNYTLDRCGCVAFYMPRNRTTNICGGGNGRCIDDTEKMMNTKERNVNEAKCNCLPACTLLTYSCKISQLDYEWHEIFKVKHGIDYDLLDYSVTGMNFFFTDQYLKTSERKALYGLTDFIADCGGLLGVFTGFSFLSIVEIVYFLSLRLMCNIRKHGWRFWSGSSAIRSDSEFLNMDNKLGNARRFKLYSDFRVNEYKRTSQKDHFGYRSESSVYNGRNHKSRYTNQHSKKFLPVYEIIA